MKPRLLDMYCGAGGAGMGYNLAGFEVVGVDLHHQKRYPFEFHRADAIEFLLKHHREFAAFHASPPCQRHSQMTKRWGRSDSHVNLIPSTRSALVEFAADRNWVIENVPNAPLVNPVTLCGSMFGLGVRRHRLFETNWRLRGGHCNHAAQGRVVAVYGHAGGSSKRDGLVFGGVETWRKAMGIDWMVGSELAEALPPAYTEFIGRQMMALI